MTCPVKPGDKFIVKIETLGQKHDGIAFIKGFTIFVPNTSINQTYNIRITRILSTYGFAEVVQ